ncbi:MAG: cation:proton antiporter [Caldisericota bacterium]|nr:cation:proton antiporter [Caldisericota bacterium]
MAYLILSAFFTFLLFLVRRVTVPPSVMVDIVLSLAFFVIIGFFLGKFFELLQFPAISGYLIAGLILSPYSFGLMNFGPLNNLTFITEIALVFIAMQSGMEMKMSFLKKHGRGIIKLTLSIACVTFIGVFTASFLIFQKISLETPLKAAILLGVLLILKSPLSTIAVIKESGVKKTEMGDTILAIAILKDIIVILLFAMLISLFGGEGSSVILSIVELIGSLAVGVIVGGLVALYMRHVNVELSVFIFILAFLVSQFRFIHIDPLLVSIITGFFIQNFTFAGEEFQKVLDKISPAIYLLFFALVHALTDVHAIIKVIPIVLILIGVKWLFTELGLIIGTKDPIIKKFGSVGLINQSGLSLVLVLIIESTFPEIGGIIKVITIGVIIVTDLFAPAMFKHALVKAAKERGRSRGKTYSAP